MDYQEILDIFEEAHLGKIDEEGSEVMGSSSCSESVENSSDEDMEDIDNPYYGCNFDSEAALDSKIDIEKLNIKEISSDEIMRYHFPDRDVAFMFYNRYGCLHGFSGRKCRVVKNIKGEVVQQTFVCHREGIRDSKNKDPFSRKRAPRPNTRCGCRAKIQVHLDFGSGRWYIKLFDDIHNHSFLDDKYEGMLPAHRKMSDYDKYQMKTMRKAGIPTSRIYGFFASQAGGYENVGYTRRDMYNEQFNKGGRNSSDAEEAINFLKGMCGSDDMMYWRHTLNEDGSLQHLFWCDGVSRMDFSVFGDVLAFDATYKKIKYNTPLVIFSGVNHHNQSVIFASAIVSDETEETYVWLLECFVEAMEGKLPVSVITDGDLSMRNAIRKVFPDAHHRLCAWHLIRNAQCNIKDPNFLPKFKQCMFGNFDIDEFERRWEDVVVEFGLENNNWIREMYEKRKMWSTAHVRGSFFAGFRTTSRCEGLHSEFGKYVSVLSNLLDFLHHFFRWVSYVRYREIEGDYESSFGETVLQTQHECLERSASNLYTKAIFKIFRPMLERSCKCKVEGGMTYIKQEFDLEKDPTLEGLIVSMSFITGTVVTIFSGTISDLVGRRPMLITSSIMFIIGGLVMLWAPNVMVVLLSRIIGGVAIALAVTFNPLYISEIAPPDIRGQLNTLTQFACSGGMFLAYILVFSMSLLPSPSWRVMLSIISIPSVAYFLLAVFYLPESPRWLVSKGRMLEAEKVLQRLRRIEDVSGELALLAEGLSPGGEDISIEEYVVAPASEILVNQEAGKDYIKLYGPNEGVTMVAQPVNGQGSMLSRSMLSMHGSYASRSMLSQQGSFASQAAANLKDPIVNLFGSLQESTLIESGGSRSMLINNADSFFNTGDPESSPFGTSDNLRAPLMSFQGDRAFGSKEVLDMRSNSSLVHGNVVGTPRNTNIGGGWQLVYKSTDDAMGGKREGLQRVYLHADTSAAAVSQSPHVSFVSTSGYDIPIEGGEAFQAAGIVSRSVLGTSDALSMPEVAANGPKWRALLEPGVKRALIVGIGLQILQQAAGINGFLYYAPQILEQAGVGALLSNLGISSISASFLVNIITTFCMLPCIAIAIRLMDVAGRRSIMLYTIPILIVCLLVLVLKQFFQLSSVLNAAISAVSVVVYESVFCMGLGVIPNIICAEIFPTSVRGLCISLTSLTYWVCTLAVTLTFPYLLQLLGLSGVFALFVGGCIISWIFVYLKVPETKGMPLEVIIEFFAIGAKPGTDPAEIGLKD